VRSIADKSLIVISLETYSVVSRLLDYSVRTNSPIIKLHDIELKVFREDIKSLYLDVHFNNVSFNFISLVHFIDSIDKDQCELH